jgi:four helix bundle protein
VEVHKCTKKCKDFGFIDQIRRSAVSVPSNIAEGEERETAKEKIRYLYIAKGSAGELLTQIMLGERFGYFSSEESKQLMQTTRKISVMLGKFIQYKKSKLPS